MNGHGRGRAWSGMEVFMDQNKSEVRNQASARSGERSGGQNWLGTRSTVGKELWEKLSADEKEQWNEMAELWNTTEVPAEVRFRFARLGIALREMFAC